MLSRKKNGTGCKIQKKMKKSRRRNFTFHSGSTRTTMTMRVDIAPADGIYNGKLLQFETAEAKRITKKKKGRKV